MQNMAKLYFNYSTMNAGKSTLLLQASYNYIERGMQTYLLTANFDDRAGRAALAAALASRPRPIPIHKAMIFLPRSKPVWTKALVPVSWWMKPNG
jgi:thymidine kinase